MIELRIYSKSDTGREYEYYEREGQTRWIHRFVFPRNQSSCPQYQKILVRLDSDVYEQEPLCDMTPEHHELLKNLESTALSLPLHDMTTRTGPFVAQTISYFASNRVSTRILAA